MYFLLHLNLSVIYFYSLRSREAPVLQSAYTHIVEHVYKGHSREPENVSFLGSCQLYTGLNYKQYSLMGKIRLPFTDSELLHRGALYDKLDCIYCSEHSLVFEGKNYK